MNETSHRETQTAEATASASSNADDAASDGTQRAERQGCTVDEYAVSKQLPSRWLRDELGLKDFEYDCAPAVRFPFHDETGREACALFRISNSGKNKQRWQRGRKPIEYGLDQLPWARERNELFLVEGPSDTQTLWYCDVPALGLPSARYDAAAWDQYFDAGPERIDVAIEPDEGGKALLRMLVESRHVAKFWLVFFPKECKDTSELFIACDGDKARFRERLADMRANAISFRERLDAEARERREAESQAQREADDCAAAGFDEAELFAVVHAVGVFIRRFVVLSKEATLAVALWVIHTHAIEAADTTPYLNIHSPQKQCGKSRLLEVLELIVARPWLTARTSVAALVRKISGDSPTLLLDESDTAFASDQQYSEALRGILNAGHRRSGRATMCVGPDNSVADFPVFCAKAIAGIGRLPDTIDDRSIPIAMQRRTADEKVEPFHFKVASAQAKPLHARAANVARSALSRLRVAEPTRPANLSDRGQDSWEPLLAIADACGLGEKARAAAVELAKRSVDNDENAGIRTLRDIRAIFDQIELDRIASVDLAKALVAIEDGPYGPTRGKDFDARNLASRLKPFKIKPESIRIPGTPKDRTKGYLREWFEPVWKRYATTQESEPKPEADAPTTDSGEPDHANHAENGVQEPARARTSAPVPENNGGHGGRPYSTGFSTVVEGGDLGDRPRWSGAETNGTIDSTTATTDFSGTQRRDSVRGQEVDRADSVSTDADDGFETYRL